MFKPQGFNTLQFIIGHLFSYCLCRRENKSRPAPLCYDVHTHMYLYLYSVKTALKYKITVQSIGFTNLRYAQK